MKPLPVKGMSIRMRNSINLNYKALLVALMLATAVSGCVNRTNEEDTGTDPPPSYNENKEEVQEPSDNTSTEPMQEPEEQEPEPVQEEVPQEEQSEESAQTSSDSKPPQAPIKVADDGLSTYWNSLREIASSAQRYFNTYFTRTRLVSMNGLFFNKASEEYITTQYLCDYGDLDNKYRNYGCEILLLYGSDVAKYQDMKVANSDMGLTIFVVSKHPTENQYLIISNNSSGGILTEANYNSLKSLYNQNHGEIKRGMPGGTEYERILDFIRLFESNYEQYFVRSLYVDDKYAFVTLSNQSNTAAVRQYILRKDGSMWEVVLNGIENEPRVAVAVNKAIPDFNLEMLPGYTVYDYKKSMKTSFRDVESMLLNNGIILDPLQISYICGTNAYCYVVTTTGLRILCTFDEGNWRPEIVESFYAAELKMLEKDSRAPIFIILDS